MNKKKFVKFDNMCQDIIKQNNLITQKKHGFFHQLRPFARKYRYIQEDFIDLWQQSCENKFKSALKGVNLLVKYSLIEVPNGQRDVFKGTPKPGVFMRFSIDPSDRLFLLKEILKREKQNNLSDDLAIWRQYLQGETQSQNKNIIPMEFHVIGRIKPKSGQSFQDIQEISNFNSNGFNGNIYLWFDLSKFKNEIKNQMLISKEQEKQIVKQDINTDIDKQYDDIYNSNPITDKILIGNFDITINQSKNQGVVGIGKKLISGDWGQIVDNNIIPGINRILGLGKFKDSTQHPDMVKKKLSISSLDNPYVEVTSVVNLQDWIYNIDDDLQRKYLGKGTSKGISMISQSPFDQTRIKLDLKSVLDINKSDCWTQGNQPGSQKWEKIPITKQWLQNNRETKNDKKITIRYQSWVKNNNNYYIEYRIVLDISQFYLLDSKIMTEMENYKRYKQEAQHNKISKTKLSSYKFKINEMINQSQNFTSWFSEFIKNLSINYRNDPLYKPSFHKIVYNSKNQAIASDSQLKTFNSLRQRDPNSYKYVMNCLQHIGDFNCQGFSFAEILDNMYYDLLENWKHKLDLIEQYDSVKNPRKVDIYNPENDYYNYNYNSNNLKRKQNTENNTKEQQNIEKNQDNINNDLKETDTEQQNTEE